MRVISQSARYILCCTSCTLYVLESTARVSMGPCLLLARSVEHCWMLVKWQCQCEVPCIYHYQYIQVWYNMPNVIFTWHSSIDRQNIAYFKIFSRLRFWDCIVSFIAKFRKEDHTIYKYTYIHVLLYCMNTKA